MKKYDKVTMRCGRCKHDRPPGGGKHTVYGWRCALCMSDKPPALPKPRKTPTKAGFK